MHRCISIVAFFVMTLLCNGAMAQTNNEPWAEYDSNTKTLTFKYGEKPTTPKVGIKIYGNIGKTFWPSWNNAASGTSLDYLKPEELTKVVFDETFKDARPVSCFWWFKGFSSLESIDGLEYLNTSKTVHMGNMFSGCSSLTKLNLRNFSTESVVGDEDGDYGYGLSNMFSGCTGLTELDLRNFNTKKCCEFQNMFYGCTNLKTIYVSDNFSMESSKNAVGMFSGCTSLRGAVEYDASNTDYKSLANYKNGYFSKTYATVGDTKIPLAGENLFAWELTIADGSDFSAPEAFTAKEASYTRDMNNEWGTLCLPYAFTAPSDVEIYGIKTVSEGSITVNLLKGEIPAGMPVLAYRTSAATSVSFNATNASVVTTPMSGNKLVGAFKVTVVPDDSYIISKNKFWLSADLNGSGSTGDVRIKGMRAYISGTTPALSSRQLDITIGSEVTAIDALNAVANGTAECYDIQGRRLNGLQKGINIVRIGGTTKKIIIE